MGKAVVNLMLGNPGVAVGPADLGLDTPEGLTNEDGFVKESPGV
jgi:hypothetical protein